MKQQIGNVGQIDESYAKGVASAQAQIAVPQTSYGLSIKLTAEADLDAKVLVEYLAAKMGGPVPKEVADFIVAALAVV